MYSLKDSLKIGKIAVIRGVKTAAFSAVAIPILGLGVHVFRYMGNADLSNYSLKNRFETAYSFKTPNSHKHYMLNPKLYMYDDYEPRPYLASPYATYGAILLFGLAGAASGAKSEKRKIKEKRIENIRRQKFETLRKQRLLEK